MELFNTPIHSSINIQNKALLSGCSLLFDDKFTAAYNFKNFIIKSELLDEEVAKRIKRIGENKNGNLELNFLFEPKIIAYIFERVTPFNLMYSDNWFHFLIESLPSLLEGVIKGEINKNTIIVSGKLHLNMLQVLHSLFNNQLNIFQLDPMKAVYSENIFYTKSSFVCHELQNGALNSNFYFDDLNIKMLKNIFEKNLNFNRNIIEGKKIFIIRRSFQRNIINLDELIQIAKYKDYDIIIPETLTFIEQVKIFSNAEKIIGPTGAWLANLLFVNSDAHVIVLNPSTLNTSISIWKKLGEIVNVNVSDYYFDDITKNEYQPIHSDFYVDCKIFENLLNEK